MCSFTLLSLFFLLSLFWEQTGKFPLLRNKFMGPTTANTQGGLEHKEQSHNNRRPGWLEAPLFVQVHVPNLLNVLFILYLLLRIGKNSSWKKPCSRAVCVKIDQWENSCDNLPDVSLCSSPVCLKSGTDSDIFNKSMYRRMFWIWGWRSHPKAKRSDQIFWNALYPKPSFT